MGRSISENLHDPGGFGRALRAREQSDRLHQDTGFFGLHMGWESGSSPDVPYTQRHGHQWRLRRSDMVALDYSQPPVVSSSSAAALAVAASKRPSSPAVECESPGSELETKPPLDSRDPDPEAKKRKHNEVEVAPGIYSPLRPATETFAAIENDFYVACTCENCSQAIYCIQNAKHVHCPNCKQVSSMENRAEDAYGVGLGFSLKYLVRSKAEISGGCPNLPS